MKIYALVKADTMANGTGGKYYHAFWSDQRGSIATALCGAKPGKRGYWSVYLNPLVTCPACLKKLYKFHSWNVVTEDEL